jgi:NitT/TauT family transport system substrate-binding protein
MAHQDKPGGAARTRSLAALSAIALGSLMLAGCGGGSPTDDANTVTIGVANNIFDLPIRVADANGYFSKQGLTVKYVTLTASTAASALQSGSVQFLNDSPTNFVTAVDKHLPETAIAQDGGGNPLGLVVSNSFATAHRLSSSSPATEVAKALAGSTGGASSPNTKGEAGVFLKAFGVDPGGVKWVSLPSPAADKVSLTSNQIDWFVTSQPTPLQIQNSGSGVVVADSIKVPAWSAAQAGYGQVVVADKDYLAQYPGTAKKIAGAVQQATAYINAHSTSAEVRAAAQKSLSGVPASVLTDSVAQVAWPTNDQMTAADWTKTLNFINSLGALTQRGTVTSGDWTNTYLP